MATFQELEQAAARQGVVLTAKDRKQIGELQNAERARLDGIAKKAVSRVDRFNQSYSKFLDVMLHVQDLVQAFARTLIVGFGMTAILIIALIVEQQRLVDGLGMFERREATAHFAAWFLVLLNASLEFVIHFEDTRRGWNEHAGSVWSLRIALNNLRYRLGLGSQWQTRDQPPSFWARQLLGLVTAGVLLLALFGSMKEQMALQAGRAWHEGLRAIVETSDLTLAVTWLSGFVFALVAVKGAQGTARYLARRTSEVITELQHEQHAQNDHSAALDAVAAAYLENKLAAKEARQADRQAERTDIEVRYAEHELEQARVIAGNGKAHGF